MISAILAFAALQMVSNEASPPPLPPSNGGGERWGFTEPYRADLKLAYEREAKALQAEMHSLQEADGGKLTAEHRAYVERKLKALLDDYHRGVRRADPAAINADGSKPR